MRKRTGENIINFWHCILLPFHRDETPAVSVWQHASRWNALGQVGATEAVVIFSKSCIELQCSFPRTRRLWGNPKICGILTLDHAVDEGQFKLSFSVVEESFNGQTYSVCGGPGVVLQPNTEAIRSVATSATSGPPHLFGSL
ncbi:MAG TPA: hypothetical protein DHW22_02280 [Planctomycetaceae bacterium]|nr:hypothetical protein [Planctomycetaceae bacterium]